MKKKLLSILLIVIIVFNFICVNHAYVFALEPDDTSQATLPESNGEGQVEGQQVSDLIENGTDHNGNEPQVSVSILGVIFQGIALMLNSFPMTVNAFMTFLARNPTGTQNPWAAGIEYIFDLVDVSTYFTVQKTVFNEVALFNADVFNLKDTYKVGTGTHTKAIYQTPLLKEIKENAAKWFYTTRLMAMMINLCVLTYIGIRMAISTVASEEARYKKMLVSWAESMIVLFFLQYIMSFAIDLGNIVLNIIYNLREGMNAEGFEDIIMVKIYRAISETSGMQVFMYSIFFWFMILIQGKFFLTYIKRVLSIMFLTIIAPFITVTYPIDKIGDNKAQAFEAWFKEYIIHIAIQPIHAAIYLVFVFTAGEIAEKAPFIAMVFLLSLGRIENIVRNIFGITDSVSMKNFDEELKQGGKGKGKRK